MRRVGWTNLLLMGAVVLPLAAQDERPASPTAADLIERERLRSTIETAFDLLFARPESREGSLEDFVHATERVLALGPAATPYLIPDVESPRPDRFFFAVYVLGRLGDPRAEEPIRRAIEVADRERTEFSRSRKAWSCLALGLLGNPDAVDLLDAGKTKAARTQLYPEMTALEATALVTAPASVPLLLKQLDRYLEDEELKRRRIFTLSALRRIGDPSVRPKIQQLAGDEDPRVREECVKILGVLGGQEVLDPLLAALDDPSSKVRRAAALGLEELRPANKTQELLAHLETEEVSIVRRMLYRTLVELLGERALTVFRSHWGRPDFLDRMWLVEATGRIGPRALNLLREGLRDPNSTVRIQAVRSLAELGSTRARETLLAALRDENWPVRQAVIRVLVRLGEKRAAPRISDMLLNQELPHYTLSASSRTRVTTMGDALVALRYTKPLEAIREATKQLTDVQMISFLNGVIKKLAALKARKDDRDKWVELLSDPDPEMRSLAYERHGELGSDPSLKALVVAFDRVEDAEREEILRALARAASSQASALVERVLLDPEFDLVTRSSLREMAAWAARRIGGQRMTEALRRSAGRREGQDYKVLAYLAVLSGPEALPTLREVRVPRVKHLSWHRGLEQDQLDWIIRQLSAGRSVRSLDRPPNEPVLPG